jgi:hypothetical protein
MEEWNLQKSRECRSLWNQLRGLYDGKNKKTKIVSIRHDLPVEKWIIVQKLHNYGWTFQTMIY